MYYCFGVGSINFKNSIMKLTITDITGNTLTKHEQGCSCKNPTELLLDINEEIISLDMTDAVIRVKELMNIYDLDLKIE